jgi:hypothetical protein
VELKFQQQILVMGISIMYLLVQEICKSPQHQGQFLLNMLSSAVEAVVEQMGAISLELAGEVLEVIEKDLSQHK